MLFNTAEFFWFLIATLAIHYLIPGRLLALRTGFLLVASYSFYLSWELWYVFLIVPVTLVNYFCGLWINHAEDRQKRLALWVSVVGSLGFLATFKYADFFAQNVAVGLTALGRPTEFELVLHGLPVGVSFFTFQAMSYSIDVYRGHIAAERNVFRFALFVSFFPQLVAGPIEKARNLLTQLQDNLAKARPIAPISAIEQITFGLFKKVAIADNIGPYVQPVFADPSAYSGADILLASVLFSIQIYCDFSGYTDIAIGTARLFGIRLLDNFNFPYFAANITDFWRRWHISLSAWLKEYLYISLGGNRRGLPRMYIALALTMLLGGLWHGPSWNFVLWGACHGVYLIVHKLYMNTVTWCPSGAALWISHIVTIPITFMLVTLTWIPFVSVDIDATYNAFKHLLTWAEADTSLAAEQLYLLSLVVAVLVVTDFVRYTARRVKARAVEDMHALPVWVVAVHAFLIPVWLQLTAVFGSRSGQEFIYFAF